MAKRLIFIILWIFPSVQILLSQTTIDLERQSRNFKINYGPTLPAQCQVGQVFLLLNAGSVALHGCGSNGWQPQGIPTLPSEPAATTRVLTTDGSMANWVTAGGDVNGSLPGLRVTGLQQRPMSDSAPLSGHSLVWNGSAWTPAFVTGSAITLTSGGTTLTNTGTLNFQPSPGILWGLVADGGQGAAIEAVLDSTVVATQATVQANRAVYCVSGTGQTSAYTCDLTPALAAYEAGQVIYWKPAEAPSAFPVTLAIGAIGAKAIKQADGITDPLPGDIAAGRMIPLWYDGTQFRLLDAPVLTSAASRPACAATLRARLWHRPGTAGNKDEVAVCAKNETDNYAWRVLY